MNIGDYKKTWKLEPLRVEREEPVFVKEPEKQPVEVPVAEPVKQD